MQVEHYIPFLTREGVAGVVVVHVVAAAARKEHEFGVDAHEAEHDGELQHFVAQNLLYVSHLDDYLLGH